MAFGGLEGGSNRPMAEINTTPLVDVMLVLLIIFIITAPLMTQALKVDLPKANADALQPKPEAIALSIDASGGLFWNKEPISDAEALVRMQAAAVKDEQPPVHLSADKQLTYQRITEVLSLLKQAGLTKVGFVSTPIGESAP
ncbi:MAG: biopolymer transporter ExbD [Thiotrichales bacterium 32-46-8]|jgi:biopolymer transport protein ExbD|nr:biopolymer transporter ExbD [Gammaproteobacteria bacterium]OYX06727.1 MAG: biopolymer transporter ExbD [Thiotrichales bacterium 32-46-8]OYY23288.1 MAG: biopolymer transporter ExbD [Thiotrichales bacterium 35-46-9]OYZ08752.1 MAG: biopolymer transporter ExbD [Thiotrichales bacterium 16-46-22]OZA97671.1 MAG: biopolymer transporter ExbD [Thiotrichales bacterium 34-46-19]HQR81939.1 biopolymer transporter ExbD [Thiotrichales bacterium]